MYQLYRLGCPRVIWLNLTTFLYILCLWIWKRFWGFGNGQIHSYTKKTYICIYIYMWTKICPVPFPTVPHRCPDSGCVPFDGSLDAFPWHPGGDCQGIAGAVISQHGQDVENSWASLMGSVFQCGKTCKFCNVLTHVDVPYTVWQKWFSIVCNPTPMQQQYQKKI